MLLALSGCASQEWKDYCSEYNCFDDAAHDGSFYGNTTTVTGWASSRAGPTSTAMATSTST